MDIGLAEGFLEFRQVVARGAGWSPKFVRRLRGLELHHRFRFRRLQFRCGFPFFRFLDCGGFFQLFDFFQFRHRFDFFKYFFRLGGFRLGGFYLFQYFVRLGGLQLAGFRLIRRFNFFELFFRLRRRFRHKFFKCVLTGRGFGRCGRDRFGCFQFIQFFDRLYFLDLRFRPRLAGNPLDGQRRGGRRADARRSGNKSCGRRRLGGSGQNAAQDILQTALVDVGGNQGSRPRLGPAADHGDQFVPGLVDQFVQVPLGFGRFLSCRRAFARQTALEFLPHFFAATLQLPGPAVPVVVAFAVVVLLEHGYLQALEPVPKDGDGVLPQVEEQKHGQIDGQEKGNQQDTLHGRGEFKHRLVQQTADQDRIGGFSGDEREGRAGFAHRQRRRPQYSFAPDQRHRFDQLRPGDPGQAGHKAQRSGHQGDFLADPQPTFGDQPIGYRPGGQVEQRRALVDVEGIVKRKGKNDPVRGGVGRSPGRDVGAGGDGLEGQILGGFPVIAVGDGLAILAQQVRPGG